MGGCMLKPNLNEKNYLQVTHFYQGISPNVPASLISKIYEARFPVFEDFRKFLFKNVTMYIKRPIRILIFGKEDDYFLYIILDSHGRYSGKVDKKYHYERFLPDFTLKYACSRIPTTIHIKSQQSVII